MKFESTNQDSAGERAITVLTEPLHVLNRKDTKVGQLYSLETAVNILENGIVMLKTISDVESKIYETFCVSEF